MIGLKREMKMKQRIDNIRRERRGLWRLSRTGIRVSIRSAVWILAGLGAATAWGCRPGLSEQLTVSRNDGDAARRDAKALHAEALDVHDNPVRQQKLLEQAVAKDAFLSEAHNNLGIVLFRRGRFHQASTHLLRAAELLGGNPAPLVNPAILHASLDQWDRALPYARRAHEKDPTHPKVLQVLAVCLIETGKRGPELQTALRELIMRSPKEPWRKWAQRRRQSLKDEGAFSK